MTKRNFLRRLDLLRLCATKVHCSFFQTPRLALLKSSSAVTVCAWLPRLSVTEMMTAATAAMRRSARRPPPAPAGRTSSAVTTPSVSQHRGAATETPTAKTSRTSLWSGAVVGRSLKSPIALQGSFGAGAESAFTLTGNATGM